MRSTTARWMIKYVLWRFRWRCFTKTAIVMILRVIMARDSVTSTANHGMHLETGTTNQLVRDLLLVFVAIRFPFTFSIHQMTYEWREVVNAFSLRSVLLADRDKNLRSEKKFLLRFYLVRNMRICECPSVSFHYGDVETSLLRRMTALQVWL